MTESSAQQIIEMWERQWGRTLGPAAVIWKGFLLREDAAIVTKAMARLATTSHERPELADLVEVVKMMRPENEEAACNTCGDDRFVVVSRRRAEPSSLLRERGVEPTDELVYAEYAPCPDCNANCDTHFKRHGGSVARSLDPDTVRARMRL